MVIFLLKRSSLSFLHLRLSHSRRCFGWLVYQLSLLLHKMTRRFLSMSSIFNIVWTLNYLWRYRCFLVSRLSLWMKSLTFKSFVQHSAIFLLCLFFWRTLIFRKSFAMNCYSGRFLSWLFLWDSSLIISFINLSLISVFRGSRKLFFIRFS